MREKLKAAARRVADALDLRDVLCFGGLGCVGYGLGQVYEPAAWCAVGAALFWLSIRRRPHGPT